LTDGGNTISATDYINGINLHNLTGIENVKAKNEDCTEMNDWMLNVLNIDVSRTYYSTGSIDYEDKSRELLYQIMKISRANCSIKL